MIQVSYAILQQLLLKSFASLGQGSNPQPPGHKVDALPVEPLCRSNIYTCIVCVW